MQRMPGELGDFQLHITRSTEKPANNINVNQRDAWRHHKPFCVGHHPCMLGQLETTACTYGCCKPLKDHPEVRHPFPCCQIK